MSVRRQARRLIDLIAGNRRDRDFAAELDSHIQLHIDDNIRAGMTPDEARRRALIALGGIEQTREQHRDGVGFRAAADLGRDIRTTLRRLVRTPGFTTAAVLTLGIGIGVQTAVFSVVDGLLFSPSPFHDADRLVLVVRAKARGRWSPTIEKALVDTLVANTDIFEGVGTYRLMRDMKLAETGGEDVRPAQIAPGFFRFLGVAPAIGREFGAADLDSPVVIVSHAIWRRVLAADPSPLGRTITLEGRRFVVVGVMPQGLRFPVTSAAQVWLPASASTDFATTVARLSPRLSVEEAQRRLDVVSTHLQDETPREDGWGAILKTDYELRLPAGARALLLLLVGAVGVVVLIACANVATLFISRTISRTKELEVRAALGASSWRLTRHVLIEVLIVALLGGALALLLSASFLDVAGLILPPELGEPHLNLRVVVFTAAVVLTAAIGCAIGPVLRVRRYDFSRVISSSRPTGSSPREAHVHRRLVATQLGLTCVLLLGTALLTNSFIRLLSVEVGFEPRNLSLITIQLATDRYPTLTNTQDIFANALLHAGRVPGVIAVTAATSVPPQRDVFYNVDDDAEEDATPIQAAMATVEPNYFHVLQLPILAGRSFGPDDEPSGVIVVNEPLARHYWPGESAVGKRLRLQASDWRLIIGVVGDVKGNGFTSGADRLKAFIPFSERQSYAWTIAARTTGDRTGAVAAIRRSIDAMDPLAVRNVSTAEDAYGTLLGGRRLILGLMGVSTAAALLLALVGIYGLVSAFVASRQQELGIRVALGATTANIRRLVLGEALRPAILGITIGLATGLAASTALRRVLFEVSPYDTLTAVIVAVTLLMAVVLVAWMPARRAGAADPIRALRGE
ncbi:MAG: ADOP family duplicated permease [Vicinamibacterales bacterium]